jgi:pantetheine-phosphate adenylyltransferase
MKKAVYPGSFNPWHEGHMDVLNKALKIFDIVDILIGHNPEKSINPLNIESIEEVVKNLPVSVFVNFGLLKDVVNISDYSAIIKGLRNTQDFEYEKIQQYWNEDLGIKIPTFYIISDRNLVHISSSAKRILKSFK